jgi:hypothetical protein
VSGELLLSLFAIVVLLLCFSHWNRTRILLGGYSLRSFRREFRFAARSSNCVLLFMSLLAIVSAPLSLTMDWAPPAWIAMSFVLGTAFLLYLSAPPTVVLLGSTGPDLVDLWLSVKSAIGARRVFVALDPWKLGAVNTDVMGPDNIRTSGPDWLQDVFGRIETAALVLLDVRQESDPTRAELNALIHSAEFHKLLIFGQSSSRYVSEVLAAFPNLPKTSSVQELCSWVKLATGSRESLLRFYEASRNGIRAAIGPSGAGEGTAADIANIQSRAANNYGEYRYWNATYGFRLTIERGWIQESLERPEWVDCRVRETALERFVKEMRPAVEHLQKRPVAEVSETTNTVCFSFQKPISGVSAGILSCVHNGVEVVLQWQATAEAITEAERLVASFRVEDGREVS